MQICWHEHSASPQWCSGRWWRNPPVSWVLDLWSCWFCFTNFFGLFCKFDSLHVIGLDVLGLASCFCRGKLKGHEAHLHNLFVAWMRILFSFFSVFLWLAMIFMLANIMTVSSCCFWKFGRYSHFLSKKFSSLLYETWHSLLGADEVSLE